MSLFIDGPFAGQIRVVEGKRYTAAIMESLPLYACYEAYCEAATIVTRFHYERHEFRWDGETLSVFAPEGWRSIDAMKALFDYYAKGNHK